MEVDQPLAPPAPPGASAETSAMVNACAPARLSPSLTSVEEEAPLGSVQGGPAPAAVPRANSMSVDPTPEASAAATLAGLPSVSGASAAPVPSPVPAIPNPLPPGYNKDQPICANCSTQTTPLWRRSHDSTHILCNACALFFKMKGRPRPISLKTDVIKSRNRSKGKSTSKDRAGATGGVGANVGGGKGSKERSESTSRSQEDGKNVRKSAPGGAEMEDDELDGSDGYAKESKVRRVAPPQGVYPGPWPYGAYPHPHGHPHPHPHPHLAHQPYPPSRERSRSSSSSRRAQSLDSRQAYAGQPGVPPGPPIGNPYGYPPPGGHYPPPPEGYPYYTAYPAYGAYPGFYPPPPPPGQPYGAPGGLQQQQHPHPSHTHPLALAQPGPSITHAQSDSRSKSNSPGLNGNGTDSKTASPRSSASPPHPSTAPGFAQYYTHPNPNYQALHASQGQAHPYQQSPLSHGVGKSPPLGSAAVASASASAKVSPRTLEQSNGRVTLAPIHFGPPKPPSRATSPAVDDGHISLPSIGAMDPAQAAAAAGAPSPTSGSARHSAIFSNRPPTDTESPLVPGERIRRASVSSNSASISDSSDGVRSPQASGRVALPWGVGPSWAPEDERRGRPERRFDDLDAGDKGKGREDDLDELDGTTLDRHRQLQTHQERLHMGGVDQGFHELRLADQYSSSQPPKGGTDSSRSRSGGGREGRDSERGRGVSRSGAIRGRSQSTSRARDDGRSSSISSNRPPSTTGSSSAETEVIRLKSKVAELTFLNSLMQSRLGQLEGPGRVPLTPMSGLASTPRPILEDESMEDATGDPSEDDELVRYGVTATNPHVRASLLQFFRSQSAGSAV